MSYRFRIIVAPGVPVIDPLSCSTADVKGVAITGAPATSSVVKLDVVPSPGHPSNPVAATLH